MIDHVLKNTKEKSAEEEDEVDGDGKIPTLSQASQDYHDIDIDRKKAGYTATLVACGWAGAVFELLKHGQSGV